ncbi:MAG: GNAT family N-acetyltransferase [Gemmatimonadota bacterium]
MDGPEAICLRIAGPDDADQIAAIHTASWRSAYRGILDEEFLDGPLDGYSRDRWRAWFTLIGGPPAHLVLAERQGTPVGFLCIVHSAGEFGDLIANLHVLLDARGVGIGRRLLREAARLARAQGQRSMHLWVYSSNTEAIAFYNREGGVPESEQPHLAADGKMRPSWRYVWPDVELLLM